MRRVVLALVLCSCGGSVPGVEGATAWKLDQSTSSTVGDMRGGPGADMRGAGSPSDLGRSTGYDMTPQSMNDMRPAPTGDLSNCGSASGQACCGGTTCDVRDSQDRQLVCWQGSCQLCGGQFQYCCATATPCAPGLTCQVPPSTNAYHCL